MDRLIGDREPVDEVRRTAIVREGLAVRVEGRGPSRRHQGIVGDDVVLACRLGVVDDLGRVGLGRQQGLEDLGVEPPADGRRQARADRVAGELVPEANVSRVDLEQLPPLRLLGGERPAGQHDVEDRRGHAARDDRDEFHEPSRVVVEPGGAPENGVRDRRRQPGGRSRREQLGDEERVTAGGGVEVEGVSPGERRNRLLRERVELDPDRVGGRDGAQCSAERVGRRHLAAAEREHEQRRNRRDPAAEDRDRVECRLVGPVDVLEHEHRRPRRPFQLGDQQALDLVRRGARVEGGLELDRDGADEVTDRAERTRDRQVVAGAEEHSRAGVEITCEARDELRLPDPGLAADEGDAPLPPAAAARASASAASAPSRSSSSTGQR